jgi:hypothetical protein
MSIRAPHALAVVATFAAVAASARAGTPTAPAQPAGGAQAIKMDAHTAVGAYGAMADLRIILRAPDGRPVPNAYIEWSLNDKPVVCQSTIGSNTNTDAAGVAVCRVSTTAPYATVGSPPFGIGRVPWEAKYGGDTTRLPAKVRSTLDIVKSATSLRCEILGPQASTWMWHPGEPLDYQCSLTEISKNPVPGAPVVHLKVNGVKVADPPASLLTDPSRPVFTVKVPNATAMDFEATFDGDDTDLPTSHSSSIPIGVPIQHLYVWMAPVSPNAPGDPLHFHVVVGKHGQVGSDAAPTDPVAGVSASVHMKVPWLSMNRWVQADTNAQGVATPSASTISNNGCGIAMAAKFVPDCEKWNAQKTGLAYACTIHTSAARTASIPITCNDAQGW